MADQLDDISDLDSAFVLPENIEDANLRTLYEVLCARMRREAQGLRMNTVQILLIERIAYNYVILRHREALPIGSPGSLFADGRQAKEFNTFWLNMTTEFNKQISLGKKDVRQETVKELLTRLTNIMVRTLPPKQVDALLGQIDREMTSAGVLV